MGIQKRVIASVQDLIEILDAMVNEGWTLDYPTHRDEEYRVGWVSPSAAHSGNFSWGIVSEYCRMESIGVNTSIKEMLKHTAEEGLDALESDSPLRDWINDASREFLAHW